MNRNAIGLTISTITLLVLALFVAAKAYQLSLTDPDTTPMADYSTWVLFAFFNLWVATVVITLWFRRSFTRRVAILCWSVVSVPGLFVLYFFAGLFRFMTTGL